MVNDKATWRQKAVRLSWFAYGAFVLLLSLCQYFDLFDGYRKHEFSIRHAGDQSLVSDFVKLYVAGTLARINHGDNVYEWPVQQKVMREVLQCDPSESQFYTQYFPVTFVVMAPLSYLPIDLAQLIWDLSTLLLGSVGFALLLHNFDSSTKKTNLLIFVAMYYAFPAYQCLMTGQLSWLLLAIISAYILCLLKGKQILAGLLLAATTVKPQYMIFLGLPALLGKQFRVIASAVVCELFLLGLSVHTLGWQSVCSYPSMLKHVEGSYNVSPEQMPGLRGLITPFLSQETALNVSSFSMFTVLILLAILFFRKREALRSKNGILLAFCVTITGFLFFSAHSEPYDSLLLAIPAAYTMTNNSGAGGVKENWFDGFIKGLYVAYPIISWLCFFVAKLTHVPGLALLGIPTLFFFISAVLKFEQEQ
jgi:Glycosyltransferase family 87